MAYKIAHITDTHFEEDFPAKFGADAMANWQHILEDMRSRGIRHIVFGGDIGEPSSNEWFFDSLETYELDITLGNHDLVAEASKHFEYAGMGKKASLHYAYDLLGHRMIFLDSSLGALDEEQLVWLESELKTDLSLMIFIHHPIVDLGLRADREYAMKDRAQVAAMLTALDKPVNIFSGHYHLDNHKLSGKVNQYVTPAVSVQVEKSTEELAFIGDRFGYRIIELDSGQCNTEVVMFGA